MTAGRRVEEGIDVDWLRQLAAADPLHHAFAAWDLEHWTHRVRFVTLRGGDGPEAYLLIWYGSQDYPVVHWVGAPEGSPELASALPERPLVAVVPSAAVPEVERVRGPVNAHRLWCLLHRRSDPLGASERGSPRRLTSEDTAALRALGSSSTEFVSSVYGSVDPARTYVAGAFESGQLVAVARAQVQLDRIWIVGGIYTHPAARGRGYGTAVTAAVTRAAHAAGADAALYVRMDNTSAVRAYDHVGFGFVEERAWLDAGAKVVP